MRRRECGAFNAEALGGNAAMLTKARPTATTQDSLIQFYNLSRGLLAMRLP
ncbi:MAG TPA: hypothetical protein VN151_08075 [Terracidiphilus sp.]|nr:hypothetical protein [Terracidiphilus sp.]